MSLEIQREPSPEPEVEILNNDSWGDWGALSAHSGGRSGGGGRSGSTFQRSFRSRS